MIIINMRDFYTFTLTKELQYFNELLDKTDDFTTSDVFNVKEQRLVVNKHERSSMKKRFTEDEHFDFIEKHILPMINNDVDDVKFSLTRSDIEFVRYNEGDFFKPHKDFKDVKSTDQESFTCIINIKGAKEGGETVVHNNEKNNEKTFRETGQIPGSGLIFKKHLLHEGRAIEEGVKIIVKFNLVGVEKDLEHDEDDDVINIITKDKKIIRTTTKELLKYGQYNMFITQYNFLKSIDDDLDKYEVECDIEHDVLVELFDYLKMKLIGGETQEITEDIKMDMYYGEDQPRDYDIKFDSIKKEKQVKLDDEFEKLMEYLLIYVEFRDRMFDLDTLKDNKSLFVSKEYYYTNLDYVTKTHPNIVPCVVDFSILPDHLDLITKYLLTPINKIAERHDIIYNRDGVCYIDKSEQHDEDSDNYNEDEYYGNQRGGMDISDLMTHVTLNVFPYNTCDVKDTKYDKKNDFSGDSRYLLADHEKTNTHMESNYTVNVAENTDKKYDDIDVSKYKTSDYNQLEEDSRKKAIFNEIIEKMYNKCRYCDMSYARFYEAVDLCNETIYVELYEGIFYMFLNKDLIQ
jgi:hypothetical protein